MRKEIVKKHSEKNEREVKCNTKYRVMNKSYLKSRFSFY